MAGFQVSNDSGMISDINVTPFVDIVLVLLIIFMSTSAVIVRTALDLEIPVASNAEEKAGSMIQSVVLREDNSLELNGKRVSRRFLVNALKQTVADNRAKKRVEEKETQALISARGKHDYQQVVDLIDLVKGTGVNLIALNTKIENDRGFK